MKSQVCVVVMATLQAGTDEFNSAVAISESESESQS